MRSSMASGPITAETALLFSRFFGNSAEFWMGLQSQYDLERERDRLAKTDSIGCSAYSAQASA